MKIVKRWKSQKDAQNAGLPLGWFETTLEECIDHTENAGYWKANTVQKMLMDGQIVFTPFAEYKRQH